MITVSQYLNHTKNEEKDRSIKDMENKLENKVGSHSNKPIDNSITVPLKPLLTPAQKRLLELPQILLLINRFDLHPFSSPEAFINTRVHNRTQTLISSFSKTKPDFIDTSQFAPMSEDGASTVKAFDKAVKESKLQPGYCLDSSGKTIFDRNWKAKGLKEKDLPPDHPDYAPF